MNKLSLTGDVVLLLSYMNCKCNDDYGDLEFGCFEAARASDHKIFGVQKLGTKLEIQFLGAKLPLNSYE